MPQRWTIDGGLDVTAVAAHLDRVAPPVAKTLTALPKSDLAAIGLAEIDPALADTARFCEHYGIPPSASANCVVVTGKRGGHTRYAVCVALATTRVNVNTVVRGHLDVRKASFAPLDETVTATGMERGGVTPVGMPVSWPILLDSRVAAVSEVVIGGGTRASKLLVSGEILRKLPAAQVVDGLASPLE